MRAGYRLRAKGGGGGRLFGTRLGFGGTGGGDARRRRRRAAARAALLCQIQDDYRVNWLLPPRGTGPRGGGGRGRRG